MPADRYGTRARIQEVALDLFGEQGYEKTSLREIAERLGMTKAALYYHFKSKDEIIASLFDEYAAEADELIEWARSRPRTVETRRAVLDRYVDIVVRRTRVFQCLERNQAAMRNLKGGGSKEFRERLHTLTELITAPDAALPERVRASMAFMAIHVGWLFFQDEPVSKDKLRTLVYDISCDLAAVPNHETIPAP